MPKLTPKPEKLLKAAAEAARRAYAPYSRFKVGAALLTRSGRVFTGCNVENASYGLTICAERSAAFAAIAAGQRSFVAIAIVANARAMPYPCGACRQVLHEFGNSKLQIYVASALNLKAYETVTLGELLPRSFKFRPRTG
ncbi:MAG: cytidine deaminase [Kiritimatiellae bacterium]|nr:cytidine deaminase [Kiritimatiellia bacterium]